MVKQKAESVLGTSKDAHDRGWEEKKVKGRVTG